MDKNKFFLKIKNLKFDNENIKFYTKKNLEENVSFLEKKKTVILNHNFFCHPNEIVFRSITEIIKIIGKKYYPVRGSKISRIIKLVEEKTSFKVTLGRCLIKRIDQSIIVTKE